MNTIEMTKDEMRMMMGYASDLDMEIAREEELRKLKELRIMAGFTVI